MGEFGKCFWLWKNMYVTKILCTCSRFEVMCSIWWCNQANALRDTRTNTHPHMQRCMALSFQNFPSKIISPLFFRKYIHIFWIAHLFVSLVLIACLGMCLSVLAFWYFFFFAFQFNHFWINIRTNEFKKNICGFWTRNFSVVIYTKCNFAHPIQQSSSAVWQVVSVHLLL